MGIRKILTPLSGRFDPGDPESLDPPALRISVRLARRFDAQVEVLCVTGPGGPQAAGWLSWLPDYGMDEVLSAMEKQGALRRRHARRAYDAIIGAEAEAGGLDAAFVEHPGEIGASVGAAGRLSDLIVLANSRSRWEQPFRPILDAALRHSGRPLFVSPPTAPATVGEHVVIAWNDTAGTARAVAAAMPFLKRAASVTVLTCREDGDGSGRAAPDEVVAYLGLHEIEARARVISARRHDVARAVIDESLSEGADLLALGSVIHSRAHSLVYGSLTEEVLKAPRLSALLAP